jgi:hypothetical protein
MCAPPRTPILFRSYHELSQVDSSGDVQVVSGVGAKGTSYMELSGRKGLGPDGGKRLGGLLHEAPLLTSLDLRHAPHTQTQPESSPAFHGCSCHQSNYDASRHPDFDCHHTLSSMSATTAHSVNTLSRVQLIACNLETHGDEGSRFRSSLRFLSTCSHS